ncbi:MAG: branched-chain amino acid ABC transporter permease [Deltaproteobacteria bacterium]|nr:MAG: branched-chain amino acid ABC transporter permease [Deltaproteobacteria bacterium]
MAFLDGRSDMTTFKSLAPVLVGLILLIAFPFVLPIYWTLIATEILIMGLLAMSFNLLFGYTGLLSFGQAAFFGTGAYAMALFLTKGGESLIVGLGVAMLATAITAAVIGILCVRRDEIYFAMITLGFGMMLYTVAHSWFSLTGGSDGLPLMETPPLTIMGKSFSLFDPVVMYLFVLAVAVVCIFVLWRVVNSPFGLMLTAIRENRQRLSFVGAGVQNLRLTAFVISGTIAGIAGALFGLFNSMAAPDILHWGFSARPVLMTILGGAGIFFGPLFGAAIFFALEQVITDLTGNWMFFLGIILIPVVIFFPNGILGSLVNGIKATLEKKYESASDTED